MCEILNICYIIMYIRSWGFAKKKKKKSEKFAPKYCKCEVDLKKRRVNIFNLIDDVQVVSYLSIYIQKRKERKHEKYI